MQVKELSRFYEAIKDDNRILPSHISLFMALFECWNQNDFQNPIQVKRKELMAAAKISGIATYHRCMKDLHNFQYIYYQSNYSSGGSLVKIKI